MSALTGLSYVHWIGIVERLDELRLLAGLARFPFRRKRIMDLNLEVGMQQVQWENEIPGHGGLAIMHERPKR